MRNHSEKTTKMKKHIKIMWTLLYIYNKKYKNSEHFSEVVVCICLYSFNPNISHFIDNA